VDAVVPLDHVALAERPQGAPEVEDMPDAIALEQTG
jgi:hypothetical protein